MPDMPELNVFEAEGTALSPDGHIEFEGLHNARDLGGIETADGRFIKHARLIRSDALGHATPRDLEVLAQSYDVRMVVDLRTEEERREKPDPEDGLMNARFVDAPVLNASSLGISREGGLRGAIKMLRAVQADPAGVMMEMYPRILLEEEGRRGYAAFFEAVLNADEGAILWHCTAGKDRAGLATVLLLHALGVSHEIIFEDYQVTNRYMASRTQEVLEALSSYHLAEKLDDSIRVINSADSRFLTSALEAVEREYGGLDSYIEHALNVSDEKRAVLRERFLGDNPES